MTTTGPDNALGLRIIGGFKFASAWLLVGLAVGVFRHVHSDPGEEVEHLVATLKLDPGNHYIHTLIERVSGVSPKQLKLLGVGTLVYALLYLVEGVGLLLRKRWAEYFTVVATGGLIPLEIYEVARKFTAVRVVVLALNVAIVAYLVINLIRQRSKEAGPAASPAP